MKRYFLILLLFCWHGIALATISVQLDPFKVHLGESFRLILTQDDPQAGGVPDLTQLQQDFNIVGTQRSTSYSIVNGQAQSVNQWIVVLTAKKSGIIFIPSIQIGQQRTKAISVDVASNASTPSPGDQQGNAGDDVMLQAEVSPQEPFVNQQMIYTVKLYNSQRLLDAEYQPPRVEDALLIPLGNASRYQTLLNGRNYEVEEQQYAIFPQKSGVLKIIAPTFNALVYDVVPRRVNAHAKTINLPIKPMPANYKGGSWLPAKAVTLTEKYEQLDATMGEGSTLVRTVTLKAMAVPAQLLPPLVFAKTSEFNSYPEQPELNNIAKQQDVIGRVTVKVTYLFNKAGPIKIPALQVPWLNSTTGEEEIASLPERTINIEPRAGTQQTPSPSLPEAKKATVLPSPLLTQAATYGLAWWIAGGFALAWIATLVLWWFRPTMVARTRGKRLAFKRLQAACASNNPEDAHVALLHWASLQWPGVELLNLHQLARMVSDVSLKKELSLLSQVLYSQGENRMWRGDVLWRSVVAFTHVKPVLQNRNSGLPPINPVTK